VFVYIKYIQLSPRSKSEHGYKYHAQFDSARGQLDTIDEDRW
jgi:hypothetical protein